jgi:hypothetical protein
MEPVLLSGVFHKSRAQSQETMLIFSMPRIGIEPIKLVASRRRRRSNMPNDDDYENVGRAVADKRYDICSEYIPMVGLGQFSYYRFGIWLERNYPEAFKELLELEIANSEAPSL